MSISSILLLITAFLHYQGTNMVRESLEIVDISPFLKSGLPTVWMVFSWHLVVMALLVFLSSFLEYRAKLVSSFIFALVILGDFFWVFSVAGWFPGTILLIIAAVLMLLTTINLFKSKSDSV